MKRLIVLMAAAILLNTYILQAFAYTIAGPKLPATHVMLYPFQQCTNTVQCSAKILAGEEITFSGLLTDSDQAGVANGEVKIYRELGVKQKSLLSTVTEDDGTFEVKWKTQFLDKKIAGETFKQQISESFTVYAQFEGDSKNAPSRSGKLSFTVLIRDMFIFVATDKPVYKEGTSALIFINFIEAEVREGGFDLGDFIDPDSIRATYDNQHAELSKKKDGSYVFFTPPLNSGHHQLLINAEKAGYNNRLGFVTVQVSLQSR